MSRTPMDQRIDAMIDAMLDALGAKAQEVGAEPHELFMASTALSVRLSLGTCRSPDAAKEASAALLNEYYAQSAS